MTSSTVLFDPPAAGFDAPFEMLAACHERVERSLRLLERIAAHLPVHGADAQARAAARDVLRYFDIAAPHHHEDEERHVLPALRDTGHGDVAARIVSDHGLMAQAWAALRTDLQAICGGDAAVATSAAGLRRWQEFAALYRRHIELEDHAAFPAAQSALDAVAQLAMGDEMARRRGVR
jgi:hemerythrin-like domain-containing protein